MKRRMEQLINGRFEYETPGLVLSDTEISVETKVGEDYQGELFIGAADNRRIKGMVVSSSRRLVPAKEKFMGTAIRIPYALRVAGLSAGDVAEAYLTVNSNLGEYRIPVKIAVVEAEITSSLGQIHTLKEFIRLAENDFREAFRLYTSRSFPRLLQGSDRKYRSLYQGLSHNPVTYQHMEEFMIAAGKKEAVRIHLDREEKNWDKLESTLKDTLYLYRSTWGYVRIEVDVRGDFLEVEKKVVTSEDFIGSVYGLEYLIHRDKIGKGKTYGQIRIRTAYETQVCQITASCGGDYQISTYTYEKNAQVRLAVALKQYRLGQISKDEWKETTLRELEALKNMGCYFSRHQLMEASLYAELGDLPRAMSVLWPLRELTFRQEQMGEEAVYLSLARKLGIATQEQEEVADLRIPYLYRMNPGKWELLHVLLSTEEYQHSEIKKLYMMEESFRIGCISPFLYLDALDILLKDENQLKKLSPFMLQVLHFAARNGKLTQELTLRIGHLSEYEKSFQPGIYQLLVSCYEAFPGKNLIDNICKYIMKGEPGRKEYFRWYALAVENGIRITRLYEYYIETMPEGYQEVLPQVIRMYFVYNNTLSSKKRASVYANVIHNKETDRATYQNYRKAMERFAMDSLKAGRINEDYAVIYQECIGRISSTAVGEQMAQMVFTYRIYCDNPRICNVVVCHEEMAHEEVYPCTEGVAFIRLYHDRATILFEDEKRRRFVSTMDYNLQKLIDDKDYVRDCIALDVTYYGLLLSVCSGKSEIRIRNLACFHHAVNQEVFRQDFRQTLCKKILEYYAAHAGDDTLDSYLRQIDYMTFASVDKVLLTEILIGKGMYEKAFDIIVQYGHEGIRTESLLKLASRMIQQNENAQQEELFYLALFVFEQEKYDDVILRYLSDHLLGPVEQLALLWEKMKGFQLETYELEEEVLLLAMFGRVTLRQGHEILRSYITQGGKLQVALAYLSFWAYEFFLGGKDTDNYIFECLELCFDRELEMDQICRLALLRYYSGLQEISDEQGERLRRILEECNEQGLRFSFYHNLPQRYTKPYQLDDKQFVEARYPAGTKVTIYYCIEKEPGEEQTYRSEPLKNMYQGIFVKEFLLFYGETLRYYLKAENAEETSRTEEQTLALEESFQEGDSKYQLINQMLAGQKLSQPGQTEAALKRYLEREVLAERLFTLIE